MFGPSKKIEWRNGGAVDVKAGDTGRTNMDYDSLNDLKISMKPIVEQDTCDCGGELKGKYFVSYIKRKLYDSEDAKGLFGKPKKKYKLRETVCALVSWGREDVKCKLCKKELIGEKTAMEEERKIERDAQKQAEKEERELQRQAEKAERAQKSADINNQKLERNKIECKACGWKGNELVWTTNSGCPRCRHGEFKRPFF